MPGCERPERIPFAKFITYYKLRASNCQLFIVSFFAISNHRVQERAKYLRFYPLLQAFTLIHMYLALFSFAYPPCVPCILNQKGGYSLWNRPRKRPSHVQNSNPTESAALQRLEHDLITDSGTVPATKGRHAIHCLTVIGTIEGHTLAPDAQKTTKYEHVIPQLVDIEEDPEIEGLLVILNTVGGDVEAGLALAELIAGVNKPSATLVLGGGHSIGIPLAVSARRSFIVPTATMTVHPVRHSGMVLGVPQTLRYFEQMQERMRWLCSQPFQNHCPPLYSPDAQHRRACDGHGHRAGRPPGRGGRPDR